LTDKHKAPPILLNLLRNAREAVRTSAACRGFAADLPAWVHHQARGPPMAAANANRLDLRPGRGEEGIVMEAEVTGSGRAR
jgi:hypothetical protein